MSMPIRVHDVCTPQASMERPPWIALAASGRTHGPATANGSHFSPVLRTPHPSAVPPWFRVSVVARTVPTLAPVLGRYRGCLGASKYGGSADGTRSFEPRIRAPRTGCILDLSKLLPSTAIESSLTLVQAPNLSTHARSTRSPFPGCILRSTRDGLSPGCTTCSCSHSHECALARTAPCSGNAIAARANPGVLEPPISLFPSCPPPNVLIRSLHECLTLASASAPASTLATRTIPAPELDRVVRLVECALPRFGVGSIVSSTG
ncbi:hypothetical protein B0H12DRAFT_1241499 [Mycena haematopus]|nr:hypothetical protein B0H12DRAFT_1241499 [Mycena haematopus]